MKKKRDICAATNAGFTEYEGLPGAIKTGCQKSPGYQSRYSYDHSPRIARMSSYMEQQSTSTEGVVAMISAKKQTRSGIYYSVVHLIRILKSTKIIGVKRKFDLTVILHNSNSWDSNSN